MSKIVAQTTDIKFLIVSLKAPKRKALYSFLLGKIIKQIVSSINIGRSQTIAIRGDDINENGILLVLFVFGGG